jgi:putative redox protein
VTKTASAVYSGAGLRFTAKTGSGHELVLDSKEGNAGPRPSEMLVVGQAGCTAMDVISILQKKRQEVTRYEVAVEAEEHEGHPSYLTRTDVVHIVEGPAIEEAAVRRAIEHSATKYCSVAAVLSAGTMEIHHRYRILCGDRTIEGEVMVTGPHADPESLAEAQSTASAG